MRARYMCMYAMYICIKKEKKRDRKDGKTEIREEKEKNT